MNKKGTKILAMSTKIANFAIRQKTTQTNLSYQPRTTPTIKKKPPLALLRPNHSFLHGSTCCSLTIIVALGHEL